ncbi:hypothetical protein Back2_00370 [Nocardioides baekrokdamisoli]|uniref:Uncharacterized protein n=1 Tax=Nocardioides baekrokdamisoli TaxID=1804624 RepID=A0A3G9IAJ6_9ACTN|nr:hypothetical protein [Nocardioides baekrokdamisoli]BBH15750.1 hypothetical protein Back2_00370 [Nocardioides baekrokdamisoli]
MLIGLACTALVLGLGAVASPWVRHQLSLSFTHEPVSYVELSFSTDEVAQACHPARARAVVSFSVTSHGDISGDLSYVVGVTDTHGTLIQRHSTVLVMPGVPATATTRIAVGSGSYDVSVSLGRSHLGVHCGARR